MSGKTISSIAAYILLTLFVVVFPASAQSAPPAFSKLSPPANATNVGTVVPLRWQAVPGATMKYCVSTQSSCPGADAGFTTIGVNVTSVQVTVQPNTTYWYQIRAYVGSVFTPANGGVWYKFTTMPAISKVAPTNGFIFPQPSVHFVWGAYPASTYARICISTTANQCNGGEAGYTTVTGTTATLSNLPLGVTLWWQMRIYDLYGGYQPMNGVGGWWSFRRN